MSLQRHDTPRRVAVIAARCPHARMPFGIRFERGDGDAWNGDWAFAVPAAVARREGYDTVRVEGTIGLAAAYPGCPHCGRRSIFKCHGCGKVSCWDGESRTVTCANCDAPTTLSGSIDRLDGGADR